jgi:protein TonB
MATVLRTHGPTAAPRFTSLELTAGLPVPRRPVLGVLLSLLIHAGLATAVVVLPLLTYGSLPSPAESAVHAFFAAPVELVPPPPPPPPPPVPAVHRVAPRPAPAPVLRQSFVAPVEVPESLPSPEDLDLGAKGGLPGGVEGGVPGGVVGGIVGGLPPLPPPPAPPRVVHVGGNIPAPALLRRVDPVYPEIARVARVQGVVILEARVDTRGRVTSIRVLRGVHLLSPAAIDAVRQWRYRPLLLNGEPTEFILTVTVNFRLQ